MVKHLCVLLLAFAAALPGADEAWAKLQNLKSGTELRVFKKDLKQPVAALFADSTDTSLIVVVKNKQLAILKDDIDRIDYRPGKGKTKVTSTAKTNDPDVNKKTPLDSDVPTQSYSTSISRDTPGFETVYERSRSPR